MVQRRPVPQSHLRLQLDQAAGAGKLTVTGKLTIKGKTADVTFPLTVRRRKQVFEGALPIKRLAYNIGEGEWKDTSMVADDVTIKFHVLRNKLPRRFTA
jgi:polyisoprenoid-binding protein YceI